MLKGILSIIVVMLILFGVGYAVGYVNGGVTWKTYYAIERCIKVFEVTLIIAIIAGKVAHMVYKKRLHIFAIVLFASAALLSVILGFHTAVGDFGRTLEALF
ncbi:hypothetical protein [Serratia liquefaciens]|uniref:hypothetical protein n=1 Tax=Serratia liquefaciens TaxID=614 RepID=UPI002FEF9D29